jgi:hypothetical protein
MDKSQENLGILSKTTALRVHGPRHALLCRYPICDIIISCVIRFMGKTGPGRRFIAAV